MSFEDLLDQPLTLLRTTAVGRDAIGGQSVLDEDSITVNAYIWAIGGEEDQLNRNTQIGDWRALIPAGTDVDGWDRATYDGRIFDIIAPPEPVWNPRTNSVHHIRLRLQEVKP